MDGFGIVKKSTIYQKGLSIEAKAIYALLAVHADVDGRCFPEVSTMCEVLQISEERFYRHMTKLKEAGLVEVTRQRKGHQFAHNVYRLTDRDSTTSCFTSPCGGGMIPQNQSTENTSLGESSPCDRGTNIPSVNKTTLNSTTTRKNTEMEFVEQICRLLNEGKRRASNKGRVKVQYGEYVLERLVKAGVSREDILEAAKNIAKNGDNHDWLSFEKTFLKKR